MLELLDNRSIIKILSEQYYILLKNGVYKNLVLQKSLQELLDSLTEEEVICLKEAIKTIPKQEFSGSYLHGFSHAERTVFWTFFLSKEYSLNSIDKKIVLDSAKYHDIGRTGELQEVSHGQISAERAGEFLNDSIYSEKKNRDLTCAIIELHSLDDSEANRIKDKYEITEDNRFNLLWKILKDSDALDRIRLTQGMMRHSGLNPDYLRLSVSKHYVKASHELCAYYNNYENEKEKVTLLS